MAEWAAPQVEEVERSADPAGAALLLDRVASSFDGVGDRISAEGHLRSSLIALAAASPWLARVCATDRTALEVLAAVAEPFPRESLADLAGEGARQIGRAKRLAVLWIAARDLLGLDDLETVGANLATLAGDLLQLGWNATLDTSAGLTVVGMGKLGGRELNYSSDVDIVLVADGGSAGTSAGSLPDARPLLEIARRAWRVDLGLRPEGRSGPVVRSLASFIAYWDRWAQAWEFQSLLKGRRVAGEVGLGARFEEEAASRVWGRPFGVDDLRQVRHLKARAEESVNRRGLEKRELKTGKGGIRDIEFAVQLLQLVHGRADPSLRSPSTLPALRSLATGGYIDTADGAALAEAYVFLRTVEHRLQLRENQQVHALPAGHEARTRLARVLGYRDRPSETALAGFESELRHYQAKVRRIHERLFFRPLMEAFSARDPVAVQTLPSAAAEDRLQAFGFADAARTHQAVRELTRGFSRSSQLMQQMLPVLLDWLSSAPDPDLGLLGLRTLAGARHCRDQLTALCRESPEAASQLCHLLGTGPRFARSFRHHPDLLGELASREMLAEPTREGSLARALGTIGWRSGQGAVQQGLRLFGRAEALRISARDVLGLSDVVRTGHDLSDLAEVVVEVALASAAPAVPFAVIGMGRLGGRELAYSSDLDLLFVYDTPAGADPVEAAAAAESVAATIVQMIGGPTPASGLYRVDTTLRPEGRQGPQARSLDAYALYYERWAQAWERQSLLRGRVIAGDAELGERYARLARGFVWGRPLHAAEVRDIRRTKARIERERVPASDDPAFHLKLGPGALADVEWTAQLLQLQHGVVASATIDALELLVERGALLPGDGRVLADAYRFCEQTRNRLALVRDVPSDSLPGTGPQLNVLARSLEYTPGGLRDEYRRRTRRARRVVERVFYASAAG